MVTSLLYDLAAQGRRFPGTARHHWLCFEIRSATSRVPVGKDEQRRVRRRRKAVYPRDAETKTKAKKKKHAQDEISPGRPRRREIIKTKSREGFVWPKRQKTERRRARQIKCRAKEGGAPNKIQRQRGSFEKRGGGTAYICGGRSSGEGGEASALPGQDSR